MLFPLIRTNCCADAVYGDHLPLKPTKVSELVIFAGPCSIVSDDVVSRIKGLV